MSAEIFAVVPHNPNSNGGCLCDETGGMSDKVGPFVIWQATELISQLAPYAVTCPGCAKAACHAIEPATDAVVVKRGPGRPRKAA